MKNYIEGVIGIGASVLCYLFGEIDTPVLVLVLAIAIDYITGMINAGSKHKVSSKTGLLGFLKKVVILLIVAFGVQLDKLIGSQGMIRNFVMFYYIANEGISILENCVSLGVPTPDIIKNILEQIREGKK